MACKYIKIAISFSLFFFALNRDDHHKGKNDVPETRGVEEGSTKRNITRKHDHDPHRYVLEGVRIGFRLFFSLNRVYRSVKTVIERRRNKVEVAAERGSGMIWTMAHWMNRLSSFFAAISLCGSENSRLSLLAHSFEIVHKHK